MIDAIKKQLYRRSQNDPFGTPNLASFKTWDEAAYALLDEYMEAFEDRQHTFTLLAALYFPLWCTITISIAITFFMFSQIRSLCGGPVKLFFKKSTEDVLIKVQSTFHSLDQAEKTSKSPEKKT